MRLPFLKKAATASEPLVVSMTGARLGDPVAFWGSTPALVLPLAARVGLSGRALAVGPSARFIESAAVKEGVLVEVADDFPADGSFDLAVVETTAGWEQAAAAATQAVRPGGRVVVVSGAPVSGLRALFGSTADSSLPGEAIVSALNRSGWQRARAIGARDGLTFVEAFR